MNQLRNGFVSPINSRADLSDIPGIVKFDWKLSTTDSILIYIEQANHWRIAAVYHTLYLISPQRKIAVA